MFYYVFLFDIILSCKFEKRLWCIKLLSKVINKNVNIESKGILYYIWMINVINFGIVIIVNDNNVV